MRSVLAQPTLVLNKGWQPVHVTTVHRALVMLWSDTAQAICPETYRLHTWDEWIVREANAGLYIRTGRLRIPAPEVIRLADYDRMPVQAVTFSRRNVAKRDHHTCQYCGVQPGASGLTIDHVLPKSKGGQTSWANCVAACVGCNARKADRTPEQAGMKLKRKPAQPDWGLFHVQGANTSWVPFLQRSTRGNLRVVNG